MLPIGSSQSIPLEKFVRENAPAPIRMMAIADWNSDDLPHSENAIAKNNQ